MRFRMTAAPTPAHQRTRFHAVRAAVAAVFCLVSGTFALYIALAGLRVTGGVPFLPDAWNQALGRGVFGLGGVITLAIAVLAIRDIRPSVRAEDDPKAAQDATKRS
jgi:hypothetical protein